MVLTKFCNNCGSNLISIHEWNGNITKAMTFLEGVGAKNLALLGVVPTDWAPLRNLVNLSVDQKVVPSGISKLVMLRRLTLDRVEELPDDFALLDLYEVNLCFSPKVVKRFIRLLAMPNLVMLTLIYNRTMGGGIPTVLGNLTSLEHLKLTGNNFTGSIPSELGRLTNLRELFIQDFRALDISLSKQVLELQHFGTKIHVEHV